MLTTEIKIKLERAFPGAKVEIEDESADHAGHQASGAHLAVEIIYGGFAGKTKVEQHQMVYQALKEDLQRTVHALRLRTKEPASEQTTGEEQ
ncbi:BolA family transcriptional regulator [Candidatus Woesearchaeota archaeon]|nr:BolA family transcriptional regulator [Candidatus Woesearchaeota archaeon]